LNLEQADPSCQDATAVRLSKRQRLGGCTNALDQIRGQVSAEVLAARLTKQQRSREHRDAGDALNNAKQELEDWKEGKLLTVDDFFEHGKLCIKPGFDYFCDKFLLPQGP
jgi:hypothetical protein